MAQNKSEVLVQRLCRSLRRTDNEFALFFVVVNLPAARKELAQQVRECLDRPVVEVTVPAEGVGENTLDGWLQMQLEKVSLNSVVFLHDVDRMLPAANKPLRNFFQQVNWRRSALAAINRPLVIWLPRFALDKLAEHAPDFYDWYSNVYELASSAEELTQITEGFRTEFGTDVHPADRLSKEEKQDWLHTLTALLDEHPERNGYRAKLLHDAALLHQAIGNYDDAFDLYKQSLIIRQEIGDEQGEGALLNSISNAYEARGDYGTALEYLKRSLKISRTVDDNIGKSIALNNIALLYYSKGGIDTALDYLKQALVVCREIGDTVREGNFLNNISQIYVNQGDYSVALDFLKKSLKIKRDTGDKSGESTTLNNISRIYQDRRNYKVALEYIEQSINIAREVGDKTGEGVYLNNLAGIYEQQGRYDESKFLYRQAFVILKEKLPENHPDIVAVQKNRDRVKRILAER